MFKITLSDIDILKGTIPVIAEIIDEAPIKIDKNGLSILCPDRTMVSVTDLKILSSAFSEFKVDSEETFGINLASLSALLKRVSPGSKLTMESEGKGNRLKITVKSTGLRTFEIPQSNTWKLKLSGTSQRTPPIKMWPRKYSRPC